jgi:hypothetical protein
MTIEGMIDDLVRLVATEVGPVSLTARVNIETAAWGIAFRAIDDDDDREWTWADGDDDDDDDGDPDQPEPPEPPPLAPGPEPVPLYAADLEALFDLRVIA